ncbi:MAG: flagellar hook-basal body protein [Selenomonas sp.]|uniref:flagellar hook-basal body protein n=1 Tax=Selenomonas ruminantium TaxID=971 RepID=UPI001B0A516A|nr:flagellar hook-basal body protein [Selenomonas ruminantium]MBO6203869.1 flagellar hook-basal body protein [Selenomonas sp.]
MWRGLYTAGTGMITESKRTDTLANNLANANTTGFKRDEAISREFEPMLIKRINDGINKNDVTSFKQFHVGEQYPVVGTLGLGSYIDEIATEHSQGAFETTGNPLDLAISGNGYFAIQTENGVRYTRDGNFYKSANGQIQTVNGQMVLGRNGRGITIPRDTVSIMVGSKGEVYADNVQIGQLQFVQFDNRRAVLKQGNNLYYPQEGAQPQPATGEIQQGLLERSNTNVVSEMVELINNYRVYEAGSKAVTTQDAMLDKSVNDVGRLS